MTQIRNRKLLALIIALIMVATQFSALQLIVFAQEDEPGVARVIFQIPDNVTMDSANGIGKTEAQYDGLVATMKATLPNRTPSPSNMESQANYNANGCVNGAPYWWDTINKTLEYRFTAAGTYTLYTRGPGYTRVAQLFIITPEEIENGATKNIALANSPSGYEGYQPGQWETFAQRKAADYTGGNYIPSTVEINGVTKNVTVNIDSRDQVVVVYPDELRELVLGVGPEAEAFQKAISGNTDVNRFPYPAETWSSVVMDLYEEGELGMFDIPTMDLLQEWIEDKLTAFDSSERDDPYGLYENDGVYVYYTSVGTSPVYGLNMPFLVFTKEDISECETLEDVAAVTIASKSASKKPTVWHQGSIHANEPGATEGVTAMLNEMLGTYGDEILDDINVLLVPRISVDSSRFYSRANFLNADPNREHLNANSPEQVAWHQTYQLFMPEFAQDGHEYDHSAGTAGGTYGYMGSGGYYSIDIMTSEAGHLNVYRPLHDLGVLVNDYVQADTLAAGLRPIHYGPAASTGVGRAYLYLLGSVTIISETRGIGAGGAYNQMPRRAYSHYVVSKSIDRYAADNFDYYMPIIQAARDFLVDSGKTYDSTNLISLDYIRNTVAYRLPGTAETLDGEGKVIPETPRLLPLYPFDLNGALTRDQVITNVTSIGSTGYYYSPANRTTGAGRMRTRPTAYVIPLDASNLDDIRFLLDSQLIEYYEVVPGTKIDKLSQYYWVSGGTAPYGGGTSADANLREEGSVTFDKGALIVPMDQRNSTIIAMTFEPDVRDSYATTLTNQRLLAYDTSDNNNYPLYRYQGDDPRQFMPALNLSTKAFLVEKGDYFTLNTYFKEETASNAVVLNYTFDGSKFEYANYTAADGVGVVDAQYGDGFAKITLMLQDYNAENLGDIMLRAKEDAQLTKERQSVKLTGDYVVKNEDGSKEIKVAYAYASFTTLGSADPEVPFVKGDTNNDGIVDLIDLSNMIDWFGTGSANSAWESLYIYFDFNNSGDIDIYDISYVAKLI